MLHKRIKDCYEKFKFPKIDESSLCKVMKDAERRARPCKIAKKRKYIDFMSEPKNAKLIEKYDRTNERIQERWNSLDGEYDEGHGGGDDKQEQEDEAGDRVWTS